MLDGTKLREGVIGIGCRIEKGKMNYVELRSLRIFSKHLLRIALHEMNMLRQGTAHSAADFYMFHIKFKRVKLPPFPQGGGYGQSALRALFGTTCASGFQTYRIGKRAQQFLNGGLQYMPVGTPFGAAAHTI